MKGAQYVFCVLVLILAVLTGTSVWAQTTIATDDGTGADTYVYYFADGNNYGTDTAIRLNKNYVGYQKFDLSGQSGEVIDANLVLYGTPNPADPPGYDYSVPIYGLLDGSDDWGETTITYSNAPLVSNPIVRHPLLVHLGWVDYTDGDQNALTMRHAAGAPLNSFLSNRGPDNKVTVIIGSDKYTAGNFFSTKEDHGDASEAPYITFDTVADTNLAGWTGNTDDSWFVSGNWDSNSVPGINTTVNITGGNNLPVVIDANASAKKVFVHYGDEDGCGLKVESGILTISDGVLRVKDGNTVDITDGEIRLAGNVEGHMWGLIGQGKIITSKSSVWETYAEYDSNSAYTVVGARKLVRKLLWGNSIVDANGSMGTDGRPAEYCVDGSDMLGEAHKGFIYGGGAPGYTFCNSYYARDMAWDEPNVKFEFDKAYNLTDMYLWNYEAGSYDLNTVRIEYSVNDVSYEILMNGSEPNFSLNRGRKDGTKNDTISFGGVPAKYVRITAVGGPGIGNFEVASTYGRYILREVQFCHEGMESTNPTPLNGKELDIFLELGWLPGNGAVTGQDIWLGKTGESLVKIASDIGPEVDTYQVGPLENLADYTWRVDGRDGNSPPTTGAEWTFSTRARLRWNPVVIGVIDANGSPGDNGTPGDRAANESGLDYDLHDSFQWSNGWYCRRPWNLVPALNEPNLLITFDRAYDINEMWVWNHDGTSDAEAAMALKTIKIEYSTDGSSYTTLMNGSEPNFVLPHGNTDGTHDTEIGFGNVAAKYVRITAVGGPGVGNYGSGPPDGWGYKLREVRFYYQVPLWSDLNTSKTVDFVDYALIVQDWLEDNWISDPGYCPGKPGGDVTGDCKVDYLDIGVLVDEWLDDIQ